MSTSSNPIATGWLNENSLREYPFHEGCGLRPSDSAGTVVDGGWTLPNCLLVDMSVSVDGSNMDPFLYLGQLSVISGSVTLVFCDRNGDRVMSVYATKSGHNKNDSYQISGTGSFVDARGVVCIGDLDAFFGQTPDGLYSFSPEETMVEPTCIRPSVSGVRSLMAADASGYTSLRLTGDVSLIAGENIRFDYNADDNALIVSADPNSGYTDECDCMVSEQMFVRSINGLAVEEVWIDGDDCIQVSTDNGVIRLKDECSKPCCGCAETAFINQTINDLQSSVNTLAGNVSSIGDRLTAFITSYVLSRKTLQ
jgi:hypothetical protein